MEEVKSCIGQRSHHSSQRQVAALDVKATTTLTWKSDMALRGEDSESNLLIMLLVELMAPREKLSSSSSSSSSLQQLSDDLTSDSDRLPMTAANWPCVLTDGVLALGWSATLSRLMPTQGIKN